MDLVIYKEVNIYLVEINEIFGFINSEEGMKCADYMSEADSSPPIDPGE